MAHQVAQALGAGAQPRLKLSLPLARGTCERASEVRLPAHLRYGYQFMHPRYGYRPVHECRISIAENTISERYHGINGPIAHACPSFSTHIPRGSTTLARRTHLQSGTSRGPTALARHTHSRVPRGQLHGQAHTLAHTPGSTAWPGAHSLTCQQRPVQLHQRWQRLAAEHRGIAHDRKQLGVGAQEQLQPRCR